MKKMMALAMGMVLAGFTTAAFAQTPAQTQTAPINWKQLTQSPGVHPRKDNQGNLKSLLIVVWERIPKSLGGARGMITAQKRARLSANAEFVKWLKQHVKSVEASGSETVVKIKDGNETGKSVDWTKEQTTAFAEGAVKGTEVIYSEVRNLGNDQMLVIVVGWSQKNVKLTQQAEGAVNDGATGTYSGNSSGTTKLPTTAIIMDSAADY